MLLINKVINFNRGLEQRACPNNGIWLPVLKQLGFLTCAHFVEANDCTRRLNGYLNRVDLHWKLILGKKKKSIAAAGTRTRLSIYCAWLFSRTLYQLSYPRLTGSLTGKRGQLASQCMVCNMLS